MKTYIQAQGFEIWKAVSPTSEKTMKLSKNNSKATNSLLNGLGESVYIKVVHCKSAKEIWDKLQNIYEVGSKVKATKL
jgi:hypothetical protein